MKISTVPPPVRKVSHYHCCIRFAGMPEDIRESQRRRGADPALVDAVIAADSQWRDLVRSCNEARAALTKAKAQFRPGAVTAGTDGNGDQAVRCSKEELQALSQVAAAAAAAERDAHGQLAALLLQIGNLVHEDAPTAATATTADHVVDTASPSPMLRSPPSRPGIATTSPSLRRLVASGFAEILPGGSGWRTTRHGLVIEHLWIAQALEFLIAKGYSALHAPLLTPSDRRTKLEKLCRERGEASPPNLEAIENAVGAMHACSSLTPTDLPLRYVLVVPPSSRGGKTASALDSNGGIRGDGGVDDPIGSAPTLWLHVVCPDDESCWDLHAELCDLVTELHASLHGLPTAIAEVPAAELGLAEARAHTLRLATAPSPKEDAQAASSSEPAPTLDSPPRSLALASVACEYDYRARRLGTRCGFKSLGERTKRHVHTLQACALRPAAALAALADAVEDSLTAVDGDGSQGGSTGRADGLLSVMPEALRARLGSALG